MQTGRIIRTRPHEVITPISEHVEFHAPIDQAASDQAARRAARYADAKKRTVSGHVLTVAGGAEQPVSGARVELHAVSPLSTVVDTLSESVISHLRSLLLERPAPVDLYQYGGHVIDAPTISFADIMLLRYLPGYELLCSAAKLQGDGSFRQMLCNNPAILRPLLCYYHPCSFTSKCVAIVHSDNRGAFQFPVLQIDDLDEQSGYFFIARKQISEHLFVTLYEPSPITWHTHWHAFDDEPIGLRTRHPLASRVQSAKVNHI